MYQLIGSNLGKVKTGNPFNSQTLVHKCHTGLEKEKSSLKPREIPSLYESMCPLQHKAHLDFLLLSTEEKAFFSKSSNFFSNLFSKALATHGSSSG